MCHPFFLHSVTIFGPESQVHIAAAMLLDHVPFEALLHVPPPSPSSPSPLPSLLTSPDYLSLVEKLKRDLQIAIVSPTRFTPGEDSLFRFRCQRSNIDFLGGARDALEEWLVGRKVAVYPGKGGGMMGRGGSGGGAGGGGGRGGDSFADAFPHFNSALLPGKYNVGQSSHHLYSEIHNMNDRADPFSLCGPLRLGSLPHQR